MGKLKESWKIPQLYTLRMDQVIRMKNQSSDVGCLTYHVVFYFWDGIKKQNAEREQSLTSPDKVVFINTHSKGRSLFSRKWRDLPRGKLPGTIYRGRVRGFGVKNSCLGGYAGLEFLLSGSICPRWGRLSWEAGCLSSHSSLCWLIKVE